jgi:thymidylate synthase (FAD)
MMQVNLLYHTPNPERAVATAARLCYAPVGAAELMESMTDEQVSKVLATIMKSGHGSALEHASYTFAVDGVSRALTHQLVRHRIASFNQQSQRYVTYSGEPEIVLPETIASDEDALAAFNTAIDVAYATYAQLVEAGIPAEDARYVLPNACISKIVITMNIRELLHFFEVRCCNRAQWEIRELARKMLALVEPTAPYVFMDAGAACRRGPCKEGKMTCGEPFEKVIRP